MKERHEVELIEAGQEFLEAVFRELERLGDDGAGLFREGARFEKALAGARAGSRRAFGTPRAQARSNGREYAHDEIELGAMTLFEAA